MARGPAYPYIGLEQAVALTRGLYDFAKRSPANLESVLREKWAYSPTSSSATKSVAALKYYGLADTAPGERGEMIKISDRAYRILVDSQESPERKQALKDAFLSPKAYKMCWDRWGTELPQSMRSTLIFEEGFIETTVDGFLANYRKSLEFSGLDGSDKASKQDANGDGKESGDSVHSTLQPTLAAPSASAGASGVGTAGSRALPVIPPKGAGMRQEIFALAEGDVTIQWPEQLSTDSYQDFTDWLDLLKRKIKRSVQASAQTNEPPKGDDVSDIT